MPFGAVLILGLFNGFIEELGWTGFPVPRMRLRHGFFATGLAVGILWGAWHFVSNLALSGPSSAPIPLVMFMPVLLFSFLPPFRVLMLWVYDRTESLLIAVLMHASLDVFWLLSTPPGLGPVALVTWYLSWAVVLWILVAVIVLANATQGSRQPLRWRLA
jgi:membrane protease YdiL (CAAX protease family)